MIIILDGVNGTGKSSYAEEISERLGIPVCRPFRRNPNQHWGDGGGEVGETERKLRGFDVPINTHVDDIYIAEILGSMGVSAVLDRSLPSAIAYGRLNGEVRYCEPGFGMSLLDYWESLLAYGTQEILYVMLTVSYEEAKRRCSGRGFVTKANFEFLDKQYRGMFTRIKLAKRQMNTAHWSVSEGVDKIVVSFRGLADLG